MTTQLRLAIANGGLDVALQPIIDLETGALHAYEVLVRWRHEGREIDPSEFVTRHRARSRRGARSMGVEDRAG
ncbi:MAG: EAL domain-containing protein [Ilumatobacteraceae bacterium]